MAAAKENIDHRFQQLKMIEKPSSNHNHPNENLAPQFIILHCIGFDENTALKILTEPPAGGVVGVSSHFLIPQMTKANPYPIYNLVPDNKKARHAGVSSWGTVTAFNNCSIGIEFHSPNYAKALQHQAGEGPLDWFHFEEFTEAQIDAGIQLIQDLMKKYNIKPENVLGHSDIAPYRADSNGNPILGKTDPGLTFPWEKLAKAGIGVWPKSTRTRSNELDTSIKNAQTLLATYGYSVPITGILDLKTQYTIKAFQMHFMPKHCDGKITAEMIICLENLIDHQFVYCNKPSQHVHLVADNMATGSNPHFSKLNTEKATVTPMFDAKREGEAVVINKKVAAEPASAATGAPASAMMMAAGANVAAADVTNTTVTCAATGDAASASGAASALTAAVAMTKSFN